MLERMTPEAKKIIEVSIRKALQLGHADIRAEHLLLAMLEQTEGVTATVLGRFPSLKQDILTELSKEISNKRNRDKNTPLEGVELLLADLLKEVRELRRETGK